MSRLPRYPIFIPSKGRSEILLTAKTFDKWGVPYSVVVEPQDVEPYAAVVGVERVLSLPDSGRGLTFSRNWILDYSRQQGHERHWQFDDDIRGITRMYRGRRLPCSAAIALAAAEDFCDRYKNVGLASLNSEFFVPTTGTANTLFPPFYLNSRCYTDFLILNSIPCNFRGAYNEDTDMSLQVLAAGLCTILFNAFMIRTPETMSSQGGQTSIYVSDGRLRMARTLERAWPGVVKVHRRFDRPQHKVKGYWKYFDTPLQLRAGVDLSALPKTDEYGMRLIALRKIKSAELREFVEEAQQVMSSPERT